MKGFFSSKLILVLVVIIALVILWQLGVLPVGARGDYQAVFLTNDQVYFGKLSREGAAYPTLRDIYYLRVTQTLQPRDPNAQPTQQLQLVKLGNELHGPQDEMRINREHILFVEDLKVDSQVVTAINEFKKSQAQPAQ